jgi:hypothetical protein
MIRRILWTELRHSAILATLVSAGAVMVSIGTVDNGLNGVAADQREGLMFLGPLALAIGAWRARRDRQSRTLELLATTARPRWQRLLMTATALAIGPVTGYLVAYTALTGYAMAIGAYVPAASAAAGAVAAGYLAALFWLGLAIGRALPYVFVPPLVVVAGFVVGAFLSLSADLEGYTGRPPPGTVLLNPIQREGFETFEMLTVAAQLAQLTWAVAIGGAALLLFTASRYLRLLAVVPVALGLAVTTTLLPSDVYDAVVPDRRALGLECTTDQPRICVRRAHAGLLDEVRGPGREALAILARNLPQAPTTVVELARTNSPPLPAPEADPDILYVDVHVDDGGLAGGDRYLMWQLLNGAGTLPCADAITTEQPERREGARLIAAAWLLGEELEAAGSAWMWATESPEIMSADQAFAALPPDEQRARVAALREAELACDGRDRLDILVGDAG